MTSITTPSLLINQQKGILTNISSHLEVGELINLYTVCKKTKAEIDSILKSVTYATEILKNYPICAINKILGSFPLSRADLTSFYDHVFTQKTTYHGICVVDSDRPYSVGPVADDLRAEGYDITPETHFVRAIFYDSEISRNKGGKAWLNNHPIFLSTSIDFPSFEYIPLNVVASAKLNETITFTWNTKIITARIIRAFNSSGRPVIQNFDTRHPINAERVKRRYFLSRLPLLKAEKTVKDKAPEG